MHPFLPPNLAELRMAECQAEVAAENRARGAARAAHAPAVRRWWRALRWRRDLLGGAGPTWPSPYEADGRA